MDRIFVAIASYRDVECQWTVRDLFEKARHPERVFVGLCWQFISPDDDHMFQERAREEQVRCIAFDARHSLGACWAKSEALALRRDEEYVLQIDSHMRFAEAWDERMPEVLAQCPSPRPILSAYPAAYEPPDKRTIDTPHVIANKFDDNRVLGFHSKLVSEHRPRRNAWLAAGYIFARRQLFDEVPYDPTIYFIGEEVTFAARAWTSGWDMFTPHECLIHHHYVRKGHRRHWDDHGEWWKREAVSAQRVRHLLGTEPATMPEATVGLDGSFGLGRARTLAEYEAFAGVDFLRCEISERARAGDYGYAP